ncbi:MAG: hypothetical protein Q7T76_04340 [Ferruginibacter sp.]|nr:hypothetical protein [Ferruginibacter sp.]
MFNNIAFDIVIGLIFIYLLYSLFATVLSELLATWVGLRARNLKEGIDRMLNDEDETKHSILYRIIDSFKLLKNPDNLRVRNFYNHPEIKYLGSTGVFKVPSSFKSISFSKTIIYLLSGEGAANKVRIEDKLKKLVARDETLSPEENIFDTETAKYVLSLWNDSYGDVVKFKIRLEAWFDRTMEQATEWYKRKIQIVLLVLGFLMAWFFNADTFTIIGKLSTDKAARAQMVNLASAYITAHPEAPAAQRTTDSPSVNVGQNLSVRHDSLLAVKRQLEADINNANSLLGSGAWLPDSVFITTDKATGVKAFSPALDETTFLNIHQSSIVADGYYPVTREEKWRYFFRLLLSHFFGFLVTAIAISLGAPFWFDLLNKLMKLRTSAKQDTNSTEAYRRDNSVSPLNREG